MRRNKAPHKKDMFVTVLKNIAGTLFMFLMIGLCVVTIQAGRGGVPYLFGFKILKIVSSSMEPAIEEESCIIIRKARQEELAPGDIITFVSQDPEIMGFYNTHRISHIIQDDQTGEQLFITKGDAAGSEDTVPVRYADVVGKYFSHVPFGHLLYKFTEIMRDSLSYFILVIAPLILCLLSYLRQLWKAVFPHVEPEDEEEDEE